MLKNRISTIFIGTGPEGLSTLEMLSEHEMLKLVAVMTQPDRPFGRKQELKPTAVKDRAQKLGLIVETPDGSSASYQKIIDMYHPDFAVCLSFGQIIPESFIKSLKHGCLNIHYSLLPLLRGAVPVQMAILQGMSETGVTIQVMEKTMDTGPIIIQKSVRIDKNETTPSLKEKLIPLGKDMLRVILTDWFEGKIIPQPQDHTKATYCYVTDISREKAQILWNDMSPDTIEHMIRAFLPWPVAWTTLPDGSKLKIYSSKIVSSDSDMAPGTLFTDEKRMYFVTSQKGKILQALEVQREGKRRMSGEDFMKGYRK